MEHGWMRIAIILARQQDRAAGVGGGVVREGQAKYGEILARDEKTQQE